jgi:phytoene dehydrogenase-like protein
MSKVVVIGAGIGGMSAAARIAKTGHQVEIFEAANFVGGKCRTEWIGRYAFDTGPSLLTLPAVYRDFFQRTGEVMGRVVELEEVNPSFDYRFHDGKSVQFANLSRKKTLEAISRSPPVSVSKMAAFDSSRPVIAMIVCRFSSSDISISLFDRIRSLGRPEPDRARTSHTLRHFGKENAFER